MVSSLFKSPPDLIVLHLVYQTGCRNNMAHSFLLIACVHVFMFGCLSGMIYSPFLPPTSWTGQLLQSLNNWFNLLLQEVFLVSPSVIPPNPPLSSHSILSTPLSLPHSAAHFVYWTKGRLNYLSHV